MAENKTVLSETDVDHVVQRYRDRISRVGVTPDSLNSGSAAKQAIRHTVHASALRGDDASVLDIGCGIGSFYEFLTAAGRPCRYTGYDIVPEYIESCRAQFPGCRFETRNIFQEGIGDTFDTVVMSQVLNNRYAESSNVEVMKTALRMAFEHARISVSVDMLSSYVDFQQPELFYYSPEEIFAFAKTLTRRVVLRHDYRPFEFCIQLFHQEAEGYVP